MEIQSLLIIMLLITLNRKAEICQGQQVRQVHHHYIFQADMPFSKPGPDLHAVVKNGKITYQRMMADTSGYSLLTYPGDTSDKKKNGFVSEYYRMFRNSEENLIDAQLLMPPSQKFYE